MFWSSHMPKSSLFGIFKTIQLDEKTLINRIHPTGSKCQICQGPLAVVQHSLGIATAAQRHRVLGLQLQGTIQILDGALEIARQTLQFTAAPAAWPEMRKVRVAGDIKNMWLIGYSHFKKKST